MITPCHDWACTCNAPPRPWYKRWYDYWFAPRLVVKAERIQIPAWPEPEYKIKYADVENRRYPIFERAKRKPCFGCGETDEPGPGGLLA